MNNNPSVLVEFNTLLIYRQVRTNNKIIQKYEVDTYISNVDFFIGFSKKLMICLIVNIVSTCLCEH